MVMKDLFKDIIENTSDLVQIIKSDGSFLYVNRSWLKNLGYERRELRKLKIKDILYGKSQDECDKVLKELISGKKIHRMETELLTKKGKRLFVEINASSKFLNKRPTYIYCIMRNISERKKSERLLRGLLEMTESILRAIPHAVVGLRNRRIFFANGAVEKVFGWKPNEIIGKSTRIFYRTEEEFEEIANIFYPILEKENTYSYEFPCMRRDGKEIMCNVSASVIGGRMKDRTIVVMYEDITESKKIEDNLRISEEKYFDLYQNAPVGYCSFTKDGTIVDMNRTFVKMLGYQDYKYEEINKLNILEVVEDKGKEILSKSINNEDIEDLECSLKRRDGSILPLLFSSSAVFDKDGNFVKSRSIVKDISARIEYRKRLEKVLGEWKATFDAMPCGVILVSSDMSILRVNKYISDFYGMDYKDIVGKKYYTFLYRKEEPYKACPFLKSMVTHKDEAIEYFCDKLSKYLMIQSTPIYKESEDIDAGVITIVDITDLKNKEKKLVDSRDAFFNILKDLGSSYKELEILFDGLVRAFVNAIDAKSPWTKGHSDRVTDYSIAIAKELGFGEDKLRDLKNAALLHDIGKIGTYDIILDKPLKLTPEEYYLINQHPIKGEEILKPIKQLEHLLPVIRHHHERFDGKGYPDGLKGDEIPLMARIICVADSFDSITSDRPYRNAAIKEYAIYELKRCIGTQFDPEVVQAFLRVIERGEI
jgi:PAS domain S-box-containing protein/putative nucleotidyltransferase with HDIG domain